MENDGDGPASLEGDPEELEAGDNFSDRFKDFLAQERGISRHDEGLSRHDAGISVHEPDNSSKVKQPQF